MHSSQPSTTSAAPSTKNNASPPKCSAYNKTPTTRAKHAERMICSRTNCRLCVSSCNAWIRKHRMFTVSLHRNSVRVKRSPTVLLVSHYRRSMRAPPVDTVVNRITPVLCRVWSTGTGGETVCNRIVTDVRLQSLYIVIRLYCTIVVLCFWKYYHTSLHRSTTGEAQA